MEPRKDEQQSPPKQREEARKKRFQLIKLEERIAPARGGVHPFTWKCRPSW
jgi:hypothetical protein